MAKLKTNLEKQLKKTGNEFKNQLQKISKIKTQTKKSDKKKRVSKQPVKQELRSKYYPLMKLATVIMFGLIITIGTIVMYSLAKYYGFDISNQITAAVSANLTAP